MRGIEDVRHRKISLLQSIVTRPGMFGGPMAAYTLMQDALSDLCWIDERNDCGPEWSRVLGRYDAHGIPGIARWFDGVFGQPTGEVVSATAEVAWRLGYLPEVQQVPAGLFQELHLSQPGVWSERDWTQGELRAVLPTPSLEVGRGGWGTQVWCFASGSGESWVCLDFETSPETAESKNPPLRDVRLPTEQAMCGLIWTPAGRRFKPGWQS